MCSVKYMALPLRFWSASKHWENLAGKRFLVPVLLGQTATRPILGTGSSCHLCHLCTQGCAALLASITTVSPRRAAGLPDPPQSSLVPPTV